MTTKHAQMMAFWTDRSKTFGVDPRANTNDVHLRRVEIDFVARQIEALRPATVLDFGCANGYSTLILAQRFPNIRFVGLDINQDMISAATSCLGQDAPKNIEFLHHDIICEPLAESFDLIFTIRVFQNLESVEMQKRIAELLADALRPGGALLYLESYESGYQRINEDRVRMNLEPLPIHPHLTLLREEFDAYVGGLLERIGEYWPSSSYYLITRLIYSAFARDQGEAIDYDHPIHRLAAEVPQVGDYGVQKAFVHRKTRERSV